MQKFPFIDLFKSAVHVSGDVFAHPQEQIVASRWLLTPLHRRLCDVTPECENPET
jgi:hypothetical protein